MYLELPRGLTIPPPEIQTNPSIAQSSTEKLHSITRSTPTPAVLRAGAGEAMAVGLADVDKLTMPEDLPLCSPAGATSDPGGFTWNFESLYLITPRPASPYHRRRVDIHPLPFISARVWAQGDLVRGVGAQGRRSRDSGC